MSTRSQHAFSSLQSQFRHECKRFTENQEKMEKLSDAYFSYRHLLHEQEGLAALIRKIFGVLGVYSPDQTEQFADGLRLALGLSLKEPIGSSDVLDELHLWEILA